MGDRIGIAEIRFDVPATLCVEVDEISYEQLTMLGRPWGRPCADVRG